MGEGKGVGWGGVVTYLSLSGSGRRWGGGGCLFEAGWLITFSAFRIGSYSRWVLIRGWVLIRINTVFDEKCATKLMSGSTHTEAQYMNVERIGKRIAEFFCLRY